MASLGVGSNSSVYVFSTLSPAEAGSLGWSIGQTVEQINGGAFFVPDEFVQFSVTATSAVREPGTCAALVAVSAVVFVLYRRKGVRWSR